MEKTKLIKKGYTFTVIVLLIVFSIISSTGTTVVEKSSVLTDRYKSFSFNNSIPIYSLIQKTVNNSQGLLFNGKIAYAFCAYSPNGQPEDGFVYFELEDPSNITQLSYWGEAPGFFAGGTWTNDWRWLCSWIDGGWGFLVEVDTETGVPTIIGGGDIYFQGLAYDSNTEKLYGASTTALYEVNIENGSQEYIGSFGSGPNIMIGIAFDVYGVLYGWDIGNDSLWTIDIETGNATLVGPLGIDIKYPQDGAFDYYSDTLYLSAYTIEPYFGGYLYECDEDTGNCTVIGQFEGNAELTSLAIPYSLSNRPPNSPKITGSINGKIGVEYRYNFSLSDSDNDSMYLRVDWGSGNPGKWLGPYASGTKVALNYTWNEKGNYIVRAQTIDIYNAESNWSELEVTMPKNKPFVFNFDHISCLLERFLNSFPILRLIHRINYCILLNHIKH